MYVFGFDRFVRNKITIFFILFYLKKILSSLIMTTLEYVRGDFSFYENILIEFVKSAFEKNKQNKKV